MIVGVGTRNPAKLRGVRRAFLRYYRDFHMKPVDAGAVSRAQPFGLKQITEGAIARGRFALREADLGVGVEAGLFELGGLYFDHQQAAIVDRSDRVTLGHSAGYPLPTERVRRLLDRGEELERLGAELTGVSDIGDRGGIIHYLTKHKVSRTDLTEQAVLMALVPRLNEKLYRL